MNAWALTGTEVTEGTGEIKAKGLDGDYNDGIAYYGFVLDRAMAHPGPTRDTVAWILDRDRQTRTKARTLISEGLPWGKALRLSWETHLGVLWTVGGVGVTQGAPQPLTDRSVAIAAAQAQEQQQRADRVCRPVTPGQCCPDFNGQHTCVKQRNCPHGLWHACSFIYNDGTLCGSTNHGKFEHMARDKAGKKGQDQKGGGKKGDGKGKKGKANAQEGQGPPKRRR